MTRLAYKPGAKGKTFPWIKTRSTGGTCFTIGFHRLEEVLLKAGNIMKGEEVERVEIDDFGITVFIGGNAVDGTCKQRV